MRNTDHTSSQDETKEKAEEKEKKEKKEKEAKPHTLKSNNPHLTGGEKETFLAEHRSCNFSGKPLMPFNMQFHIYPCILLFLHKEQREQQIHVFGTEMSHSVTCSRKKSVF